jgi:hypothetical protein
MNSQYPKGSVWRKWDLHIHTPVSIVQEYGGSNEDVWNRFIRKLASLPSDIKVIGITDYLFCDGYKYLLTRRNEIPNIELIIPNIEFRLNTFSGGPKHYQRHNFHVLFDPDVAIEDIEGQLLNCLSTGYMIQDNCEWRQTPTIRSLEALGKKIKAAAPANNSVHERTDLVVGFSNITYKREDILEQLKKDCFKGKFVTTIGYSEWDQSRWDQSAAEKRDLINVANFCMTCSDDISKISKHREDLRRNNLPDLVLQSSDAHKLDDIDKTLLWIKADPTFAGLKQVLNESNSRVWLGVSPPNYKPDHEIISRISIPSSNGWFPDGFEVELNRDLVTIIGGRGSGKSALAEAIAYGAGSNDKSDDAFFNKAAKHPQPITGTKIVLTWGEEYPQNTEFVVGDLTNDQGYVRYLPQGAVEELCSPTNSEILQEQIENVIFQALDETEKMGVSNFDELKDQILSNFQYEKENVAKNIADTNQKLCNIISTIKSLPEKEKFLTEKKNELALLNKSMPELPSEDKKGQEELSKFLEEKKLFEDVIIDLQAKLSKITEIETKIRVFKGKIEEFSDEMSTLLSHLGILEKAVFAITINEVGIKKVLDKKKEEIAEHLKDLREGSKKDAAAIMSKPLDHLSFNNLQTLTKGIEEKQKETRAFETTKIKYQKQKKVALNVESSIKALENEVKKIKTEAMPERERLEKIRIDLYCSYFDLLKHEKTEIEKLYKPLQDSLLAGTETDKKLVFEARINYKRGSHSKNGLEIIDRTRKGNFRGINSLVRALNTYWESIYFHDFEKKTIESGIEDIIKQFTVFEGSTISIESQLREDCCIQNFYDWLFDPTYFTIVSSLQFDGTELYFLSPGQKGIILLMLYLEIDKADYRPLIIDQPEENLDNLSVYKDLIDFFRDRKQYRQIIMVTHNPNLVVNTDAEQVVIADYDGKRIPRLKYCSGSLEDQAKKLPNLEVEKFEDGIIEQVCNILEGGEKAFDNRKKKYQISHKSKI